jgi:hypothetical protein
MPPEDIRLVTLEIALDNLFWIDVVMLLITVIPTTSSAEKCILKVSTADDATLVAVEIPEKDLAVLSRFAFLIEVDFSVLLNSDKAEVDSLIFEANPELSNFNDTMDSSMLVLIVSSGPPS